MRKAIWKTNKKLIWGNKGQTQECVSERTYGQFYRVVVLNWGWFCSPADIWQCLETFLGYWHQEGSDQSTAKYSVEHRTDSTPTPQKLSSQRWHQCHWQTLLKKKGMGIEGGVLFPEPPNFSVQALAFLIKVFNLFCCLFLPSLNMGQKSVQNSWRIHRKSMNNCNVHYLLFSQSSGSRCCPRKQSRGKPESTGSFWRFEFVAKHVLVVTGAGSIITSKRSG